MTLRYSLSRLSRPAARRAFGRAWLGVCLTGAVLSVLVFGARSVFLVAAIWLLCVFAPVRIAAELLHTVGPRLRGQLSRDLARRPDRYATREDITLMVEDLFSREVQLPRLAPPGLAPKVVEAAVRLCARAYRGGPGALGVLRATATCAVLLERWVGTIAAGEEAVPAACARSEQLAAVSPQRDTPARGRSNGAAPLALWDPQASIQDQWGTLRAVAGLAALVKTLAAVYEDSASRPMEGGAAVRTLADAAMDYVDQTGLRLEGPVWEGVAGVPRVALPHELTGRLAETWTAFCAASQPAPRRLGAFVDAVPE